MRCRGLYPAPFDPCDVRRRQTGLFSTLDEVIGVDPALFAQLLGFVRYARNPALQLEALPLTAALSSRLPDLLPLLASAGGHSNRKPICDEN